jgi:hypothetical protein
MANKRSASLLKYFSNQSDVVNARQALSNYVQTYKGIESQYNNTPATNKNFSTILAEYRSATSRIDKLQADLTAAETAATIRYEAEKTKSSQKKESSQRFDIQGKLNPLYVQRNAYLQQNAPVPASLEDSIKNLETQLSKVGVKGPDFKDLGGGGTGGTLGTGATGVPQSALSTDVGEYLKGFVGSVEKTKQLQQALKDAKVYKGPVDGIFRADVLLNAAIAADDKLGAYEQLGITFADRLEGYARLAAGAIGDSTGEGAPFGTVSDDTEAAGYVRSVFKSVLQRDPTADEVAKYSDTLKKAQRKNLKKTVNGITTGGLDNPIEFLTQEVEKLPEFSTKKKEKDTLTTQDLQSVARANGITLGADQLAAYADEVRNGKDIKVIKNNIRNIASYGMPDNIKKMIADGTDLETIYAPYKQTMASVLELNPVDITLDDSVLRSAIGPDKEMPLYEFKKMLKKDSRWQYTNNARAEVSDKVLRVLQDFGFQG